MASNPHRLVCADNITIIADDILGLRHITAQLAEIAANLGNAARMGVSGSASGPAVDDAQLQRWIDGIYAFNDQTMGALLRGIGLSADPNNSDISERVKNALRDSGIQGMLQGVMKSAIRGETPDPAQLSEKINRLFAQLPDIEITDIGSANPQTAQPSDEDCVINLNGEYNLNGLGMMLVKPARIIGSRLTAANGLLDQFNAYLSQGNWAGLGPMAGDAMSDAVAAFGALFESHQDEIDQAIRDARKGVLKDAFEAEIRRLIEEDEDTRIPPTLDPIVLLRDERLADYIGSNKRDKILRDALASLQAGLDDPHSDLTQQVQQATRQSVVDLMQPKIDAAIASGAIIIPGVSDDITGQTPPDIVRQVYPDYTINPVVPAITAPSIPSQDPQIPDPDDVITPSEENPNTHPSPNVAPPQTDQEPPSNPPSDPPASLVDPPVPSPTIDTTADPSSTVPVPRPRPADIPVIDRSCLTNDGGDPAISNAFRRMSEYIRSSSSGDFVGQGQFWAKWDNDDGLDAITETAAAQIIINSVHADTQAIVVDGIIGKRSMRALKDAQQMLGISVDGAFGPQTLLASANKAYQNKQITIDQLLALHAAHPNTPGIELPQEARQCMQLSGFALDADGDQQVDNEELSAGIESLSQYRRQQGAARAP